MGCCNEHGVKNIDDTDRKNKIKQNYIESKSISSMNDIKMFSSNLLSHNKDPFNKHYKVMYSIGGGAFGKVYKCKHLSTGQERALKVIKLQPAKDETTTSTTENSIIKEIEILAQLDHPNIMKVYEYFMDKYNIYIAMELMEGGDLYEFLHKIKYFSEVEAAVIMKQLLSAVHYVHSKGIVHRDLKPENIVAESDFAKNIKRKHKTNTKKISYPIEIKYENNNIKKSEKSSSKQVNHVNYDSGNINMLQTKDNKEKEGKENNLNVSTNNKSEKLTESFNLSNINNEETTNLKSVNTLTYNNNTLDKQDFSDITVKIIDFGAASYFIKNKNLKVKVGTPYYIAPEVLKKEYNQKCDVWSLGVIMYILLCGKAPFEGRTTDEIFQKILEGKYSFNAKYWSNISQEAKDLITLMLTYDYKERPSAMDCLKHKWITSNIEEVKKRNSVNYKFDKSKAALDNLRTFSIKHKFQQATIAYLIRHVANKELFKELKDIFEEFDTNGDGTLSYEEVKAGFEKYYSNQELASKELDEVIKKLDQDQNDCIEYEEFLRNIFNMQILLTKENLKLAFEAFDKDGNGVLTPDEIKEALGVLNDEDDGKENIVLRKILETMDADGNGEISFDEFYDIMMRIIK